MCKGKSIKIYYLSIIVVIGILMLNSCSIETEFDFIVLNKNNTIAFLNMHESEITKRLGTPISTNHISNDDSATEYQYDGITIICEKGKVINIKLSNSKYKTIGGISFGNKQKKILGYYIFTSGIIIGNKYATFNNEVDSKSEKFSTVIMINSRDNLGKNKYLSGDMSDESEKGYSAFIFFERAKVSLIELRSNNIVYVDF